MMFAKKSTKISMVMKDVQCCQCHKHVKTVYIKPEQEEEFRDGYTMCSDCFIELVEATMKKGEKK